MKMPNINIVSNVYPTKGDTTVYDQQFIKHIRGRNALKKLIDYVNGSRNHDDQYEEALRMYFTHEQIFNYWTNDISCSYATGATPFGEVYINGVIIQVCRCNKADCREFKNCRPDLNNRG